VSVEKLFQEVEEAGIREQSHEPVLVLVHLGLLSPWAWHSRNICTSPQRPSHTAQASGILGPWATRTTWPSCAKSSNSNAARELAPGSAISPEVSHLPDQFRLGHVLPADGLLRGQPVQDPATALRGNYPVAGAVGVKEKAARVPSYGRGGVPVRERRSARARRRRGHLSDLRRGQVSLHLYLRCYAGSTPTPPGRDHRRG